MLSISIFALVFLSIVRVVNQEQIRFVYNKSFFASFTELLRQPAYLAVATLFLVIVISGVNSELSSEWLDQLRLKIPFLAFPIIFLNRPRVDQSEYRDLYFCLIAISFISAIHVCFNYLLNFESITYDIGSGKTIPTPTHHTRYSVMVAVAVLSILVMHISSYPLLKIQKQVTIGIGILLFVFLHLLSIRSGLLVFYVGIFLIGSWYLIKHNQYLLMACFLVLLGLVPIIAYRTIPSFYNKVHYTMYDLKMNKEGKGADYSDSERLLSIKTGIDIAKKHLFLGTGIGDLHHEVSKIYLDEYQKSIVKLPHNQFVLNIAGMGILLGMVYLLCYLFPLLHKARYKDLLLLSLFIGITILCMVEKPLERSGFIVFYGFFVCAAISYNKGLISED